MTFEDHFIGFSKQSDNSIALLSDIGTVAIFIKHGGYFCKNAGGFFDIEFDSLFVGFEHS